MRYLFTKHLLIILLLYVLYQRDETKIYAIILDLKFMKVKRNKILFI